MENSQLRFDRRLCNECPAQSQCSIGRFAVKFVIKNIEPEVDAARTILDIHINRAFEEVYGRDPEGFNSAKKSIDDELSRTQRRYERSMIALDELLEIVFDSQALSSETLKEIILDKARQDFMSIIDTGTSGIPTIDELMNMSRAAKEWLSANECFQDLSQL
jgi:hypothetical protein